jgi:hypothetical protein
VSLTNYNQYQGRPANQTQRNINVFGMSFIIATALFFFIIDMVLLKFLIYLSTFRKVLSPRIESWIQDGVLQLQRRAYEAHNQGTWSALDKEVPLTEANELLGELPQASLPSANTSASSTPPNVPKPYSATQPPSNQAPNIVSQPTPPQPTLLQPTSQQATSPSPALQQAIPLQSSMPQPALPQPIQPPAATHSTVNQGANIQIPPSQVPSTP